MKKYKLNKRDYIALYPLASPEKIVNDFGKERCVTASMIRKHYRDEKLESPMKARQRIINAMIDEFADRTIDRDSRNRIDISIEEAEERVSAKYQEIKQRILQDVRLYEERNVPD